MPEKISSGSSFFSCRSPAVLMSYYWTEIWGNIPMLSKCTGSSVEIQSRPDHFTARARPPFNPHLNLLHHASHRPPPLTHPSLSPPHHPSPANPHRNQQSREQGPRRRRREPHRRQRRAIAGLAVRDAAEAAGQGGFAGDQREG